MAPSAGSETRAGRERRAGKETASDRAHTATRQTFHCGAPDAARGECRERQCQRGKTQVNEVGSAEIGGAPPANPF